MLEINGVDGFYADLQVLRQVSMLVNSGEVVALFGPNGHGKSTLLKTICGLHKAAAGSIKFEGQEISSLPAHKIVEMGIAYIPEERHLFRVGLKGGTPARLTRRPGTHAPVLSPDSHICPIRHFR